MTQSNVANAFLREFEAFRRCLKDTVEVTSDSDWVAGEKPRNRPVHQACHCLVALIGYTRASIDTSRISFRFKEPEEYPARSDILAAIADLENAIPSYVDAVVGKTLTDKQFAVPPLFRMIYLLRHSIVHLSYMRDELSRRGYRLPEYSKRYCPRN